MESKLLEIIKNNGTGIYKGFFRSSPGSTGEMRELDCFSKGIKMAVAFSKDEIYLGTHFLLVEETDKGRGMVSCIIIHNDGDDTPYQPLERFRDPVYIDLFFFGYSRDGFDLSQSGEFIAHFPAGDPRL